uniref:Branched-chain-amino-acid aminotransferase n=1 Tax=Panagrolaimus sp. JU765 TaxID=591449 RepID=A0AC34Q9Z3_9BILA
MERMRRSALRAGLPGFEPKELSGLIRRLILEDIDWVPRELGQSLYIRPTMIGTDETLGLKRSNKAKLFVILTPVDGYFDGGDGVCLLADPKFVRSFPGGVGAFKMGSNYAPTIICQEEAEANGCAQNLWLYGKKEYITEVGTMNIFVHWKTETGKEELATPPLTSGLILPGVTRDSLMILAKENGVNVAERDITISDIRKAAGEQRMLSMFGCGTAAVVEPISSIKYVQKDGQLETINVGKSDLGLKLKKLLTDIQYGKVDRPEWITFVN